MLKKLSIFIAIAIIVIVGSWMIFSGELNQISSKQESEFPQNSIQESVEEEVKKEATLIINDGEGLPRTFEAEFKEGMTASDLLKKGVSELDLVLKTKSYDIGIFIEAIGDKENGQDEKYWMYYVNGEMPMVAADKKEIKVGDRVEFKFEKSVF